MLVRPIGFQLAHRSANPVAVIALLAAHLES